MQSLPCAFCQKKMTTLRCSRCHTEPLCSEKCRNESWIFHSIACYPIDANLLKNPRNFVLFEALSYHLFKEYQSLKTVVLSTHMPSAFHFARYTLYGALIEMILIDPAHADMPIVMDSALSKRWNNTEDTIKRAGIMLMCFSDKSNNQAVDTEVWKYIPPLLRMNVQLIWHSVGHWC